MNDTNATQDDSIQDDKTLNQHDDNQYQDEENTLDTDESEIEEENNNENPITDEMTEIEKLKRELAAMTETAKRAMADLQNFKKRAEEEKSGLQQFAAMNLILQLLPIHENFKRAFDQTPDDIKENQWVEGIINIEKQFKDVLEKQGIQEIKAYNEDFDPQKHEAMMKGPGKQDEILEVFEPGYMMGDKVLKPAKVKVGDGSKTKNEKSENNETHENNNENDNSEPEESEEN